MSHNYQTQYKKNQYIFQFLDNEDPITYQKEYDPLNHCTQLQQFLNFLHL